MYSAELYHVTDDYTSEVEYDYTETLETGRKSAVRPLLSLSLSLILPSSLSHSLTPLLLLRWVCVVVDGEGSNDYFEIV